MDSILRASFSGKLLRCFVPTMAVVFCIGCGDDGPSRLAVYGNVDWQGEDVAAGSITYVPINGTKGPSASITVTDGEYEFNSENGPVPGNNRVIITFVPSKGSAMFQQQASQKHGEVEIEIEDPGLEFEDSENDPEGTDEATSPDSPADDSSGRRGNSWRFDVDLSNKDSLRKDFTLK